MRYITICKRFTINVVRHICCKNFLKCSNSANLHLPTNVVKKFSKCSKSHKFNNGPVTLGCDYRTIIKSDPILLILKSELDVSILKTDKFAVTLLRFIGTDFIARNDLSCDGRTMIVRWLQVKNIVLRLFENLHWFANRIANQYRLFLVGSDFVFGLKIGSDDRTIAEKFRVRPADFKIVR